MIDVILTLAVAGIVAFLSWNATVTLMNRLAWAMWEQGKI